MARKICDFNHISPELNREQVDELIGYYKTTHQKWFLYKSKAPVSSSWMNVTLCLCFKTSFRGNL